MVHCVCMVSDFFYPNMGGVESHIFQLSQCLLEQGHKVIVVTHFYDDRIGIRYMTNFLKVYYLPILPFYNKSILPTIVGSLPYLRNIFLSENVTIVHGHSAFSSLAHEALFVASLLDIPSVFTDHSLFGFSDASAIVTNSFLKYSLANTSHTICVSHTGKENTVLRSDVSVENVSVIPNAVDSVKFRPKSLNRDPLVKKNDTLCETRNRRTRNGEKKFRKFDNVDVSNSQLNPSSHKYIQIDGAWSENCSKTLYNPETVNGTGENARNVQKFRKSVITIVLGSRLVYRKGIDIVVDLLPTLCRRGYKHGDRVYPIHFIIAGEGPKRIIIEEVIEKYNLQQRVTMLGELQHSDMRDKLLVKGDIFLNTSLTEAFCMAIVEAVSCGLTVVSTNVGGIPEVLPRKFIYLVEPNVNAILNGIYDAIEDMIEGRRPSAADCNDFVRRSYSWRDVAVRTYQVYETVSTRPVPTLAKKVRNLWDCGPMAGPMMAVVYLACHYIVLFLNWFSPIARDER